MKKFGCVKLLLAVWLVMQTSPAVSQSADHKGRDFFLAFLPNPVEPITLQLHLQSDVDAAVLIEYPVGVPLQDSVRIGAGESRVVAVPAAAGRLSSWPGRLQQQGDANAIRVSASTEISCTLISRNDASSDAGLAIPNDALQQNYVVMSYDISQQSDGDAGVFAVIAPFDSTIVTITPVQPLSSGAQAHVPFRVTLQRGEAFLAESLFEQFGVDVSLAGSFVKSNKPISVINGNKCARVPFGFPSCDHLFEIAPPIQTWGKEVPVHALGQESIRPSGATYRILTSVPNTTVFLDGAALGTIDENQYIDIDSLSGSHIFSADQPILVTQFMTSKINASSQSADPAMINMAPTEQFLKTYTFSLPVDAQNLPFFENNLITAIVANADIGLFALDGAIVPAQEFTAIPNSDYSVATIEIAQDITHSTSSRFGHSVLVWGFSNDNSYSFPAGMGLAVINPLDDAPPDITVRYSESLASTAFGTVFDNKTGSVAGRDTLLYGGERSGIADIEMSASQNVLLRDLSFVRGDESGTFTLTLAEAGEPGLATVSATDLSGNQTSSEVSLPIVTMDIVAPPDQIITTDEQVDLTARSLFRTLGDDLLSQFQILDSVLVNGQVFTGSVLTSSDSSLSVTLPLAAGKNEIIARRLLRHRAHSDAAPKPLAFAADTITVVRAAVLICEGLRFISPLDSQVVRNEQVTVALESTVRGGLAPIFRNLQLSNLNNAQSQAISGPLSRTDMADTTSINIPLDVGWNRLVARLTLQDAFGQTSVCSDTIDVFRPQELLCELKIVDPQDGTNQTTGLFPFQARLAISGGVLPYADTTGYFIVNGDTLIAQLHADSTMTAEVLLQLGQNSVEAVLLVEDAMGQQSRCAQTITVAGVEALQCNIFISNFSDGDFFSTDSLVLKVEAEPVGGVFPIEQQSVFIIVNGDSTVFTEAGRRTFSLTQPALQGHNSVEVIAMFTDAINQQTSCSQRISLTQVTPLRCDVQIISPEDRLVVANDSIEVVAVSSAQAGVPPYTVSRSINGLPVSAQSDTFRIRIPLALGENGITVTATYQDQGGQKSTCGSGIIITREKGPLCDITIIEPKDGEYVIGDSVLVRALREINGGSPPFTEIATINGIEVEVKQDTIQLWLPIFEGNNTITAATTVIDSVQQRTSCEQTINVIKPSAPVCEMSVLEPADGSLIVSDSVWVSAVITAQGGVSPYQISAEINGFTAVVKNDTVRARVPFQVGENPIIITTILRDSIGQQAHCETRLSVTRPPVPVCELEILQPADSLLTTADSVVVRVRASVSSGVQPYADTSFAYIINGDTLQLPPAAESIYAAKLPISIGENRVTAFFSVTDSLGQIAVCADTISIFQAEPIACNLHIIAPADGDVVTSDSVRVRAVARVSGGIAPTLQRAIINGIPAAQQNDTLTAVVALELGSNTISASAFFADVSGGSTNCSQSIEIVREIFAVRVRILSPRDSSYSCEDSLLVSGTIDISGGEAPFEMNLNLNGQPVTTDGRTFSGRVAHGEELTQIVASATASDALGRQAAGADTATVLQDNIPPTCSFKPENGKIVGIFADFETGLVAIEPEYINNGRLVVEPFQPGAKIVKFEIVPLDPDQAIGFNIDLTDGCGNSFLCDPFYLSLEADFSREINLTFPSVDRYFYLENHGLEQVDFELNGKSFSLSTATSSSEATNHYLMPAFGKISFDLLPCLRDEGNLITINFNGPAGSSADLLLMDVDTGVEYVLEYAEALPTAFQLLQNYPNPFNPETTIPIQIPANWPHRVKMQIFNATGRLIKTLHNDILPAGRHTFSWDGTDQSGGAVASGVYLYRAISGEVVTLKKLVLAR